MALPLVLGVVASFFGGAYAGQVINNATEQPDVVINTDSVNQTNTKRLTGEDILIAGALGVAGWYIYKRWLK